MLLDERQVQELFDTALMETEAQLVYLIKVNRNMRPELLAQLDALVKVKERIDARIDSFTVSH
jgi:hypothetical protein